MSVFKWLENGSLNKVDTSEIEDLAELRRGIQQLAANVETVESDVCLSSLQAMGLLNLFDDEQDSFTPARYRELVPNQLLCLLAEYLPAAACLVADCHSCGLVLPGQAQGRAFLMAHGAHNTRESCFEIATVYRCDQALVPTCDSQTFLHLRDIHFQACQETGYRRIEKRYDISGQEQLVTVKPCTQARLHHKRALDLVFQLCGHLWRGIRAAKAFAAERVLFKRPLAQFPLTQARFLDMELRIAQLQVIAWDLCHHSDGERDDLKWLTGWSARTAQKLAGDLMQLYGGSGYMMESGMPDTFMWVLALIERYAPDMTPDLDLLEGLVTEVEGSHLAALTGRRYQYGWDLLDRVGDVYSLNLVLNSPDFAPLQAMATRRLQILASAG